MSEQARRREIAFRFESKTPAEQKEWLKTASYQDAEDLRLGLILLREKARRAKR